jgi:hypothetical protein
MTIQNVAILTTAVISSIVSSIVSSIMSSSVVAVESGVFSGDVYSS